MRLFAQKLFFFLITPGLIVQSGCKKEVEIPGHRLEGHIIADGDRTEWNNVPVTYFDKQDIALGICNNDHNLFIFFSFKDSKYARTIRMNGLKIWLDATGEKKKEFGLIYRGGPSPAELPQTSGDRFFERLDEKQSQESASDTATRFAVIRDEKDLGSSIPAEGGRGPAAGYASTPGGIYTYEFSIPLKESDIESVGIGAGFDKAVSIGFEWSGFGRNAPRRMPDDFEGRPGGGMRPPGSIPGTGGQPGGPGRIPNIPEKQEIWIKTTLASAIPDDSE